MSETGKEKDKFYAQVSLLLGITHGSISEILLSPDDKMRQKVFDLKLMLDKKIGELYYPAAH